MKKKLLLPKFRSEDEERDFWSSIDLSDYFETTDFVKAQFPDIQLTATKPVSIRFPIFVINAVRKQAAKMGVSYSSLIKQAVYEKYIANGGG